MASLCRWQSNGREGLLLGGHGVTYAGTRVAQSLEREGVAFCTEEVVFEVGYDAVVDAGLRMVMGDREGAEANGAEYC